MFPLILGILTSAEGIIVNDLDNGALDDGELGDVRDQVTSA